MSWNFDASAPIYLQLVEKLKLEIISGSPAAGEKLASVRDLSQEAGVNPNTMQRALAELERENLIYSERTSGRYVTEDEELIRMMRQEIAREKIRHLLDDLTQLGFSGKELKKILIERMEQYESADRISTSQ